MDATDDKGNAVDLTALEPGEEMVRVLRGTLRYVPDHIGAARATAALAGIGRWRDDMPHAAPTAPQQACVDGAP